MLANHMKEQSKKHQNTRFIDEKLKTKSLMFFVSFFIWLARFQISICEPQAFGASFLYWVDFKKDDFWTCFFFSSGFSIRIYKDFGSISNQSAMMKNEIAQKWFPICVSTISNNLSERKALNWHDHAKVTNKTRYSMWKIREK